MAGRPRKPVGPQAVAPDGVPKMPSGLSETAQRAWDKIVDDLVNLGTLSIVDATCIAMAARYIGHYLEAEAEVQKDGLTVETKQGRKAHPSLRARDDSARILKSYLAELGLTPASRSKVTKTSNDDEQDLDDFLDSKPNESAGPAQPLCAHGHAGDCSLCTAK